MSDAYKNEAEGYADRLRQQARWSDDEPTVDSGELRAAADFIERQQADIEALIHYVERHLAIASAVLSYDANYLHHG